MVGPFAQLPTPLCALTRSFIPISSSGPRKATTHAPDKVIPVVKHRNCGAGSLEAFEPLCGMQTTAAGPPGGPKAAEQVGLGPFWPPGSPTRPSVPRIELLVCLPDLQALVPPVQACPPPGRDEGEPAGTLQPQPAVAVAASSPCLPLALAAMPPPPPKPCAAAAPQATLLSGSLASSSQREALTAPPSRLLSAEGVSDDKDEYLMRLLRKGTSTAPPPAPAPAPRPPLPPPSMLPLPPAAQGAPPLALHQTVLQEGQQGFRAPGPVRRVLAAPSMPAPPSASPPSVSPSRRLPRQASTSLASPSSLAGAATVPSLAAAPLMAPAPSSATATTDQAVPASHHTGGSGGGGSGNGSRSGSAAAAATAVHAVPRGAAAGAAAPAAPAAVAAAAAAAAASPLDGEAGACFAATRKRLGDEMAYTVRNTMIRCEGTPPWQGSGGHMLPQHASPRPSCSDGGGMHWAQTCKRMQFGGSLATGRRPSCLGRSRAAHSPPAGADRWALPPPLGSLGPPLVLQAAGHVSRAAVRPAPRHRHPAAAHAELPRGAAGERGGPAGFCAGAFQVWRHVGCAC